MSDIQTKRHSLAHIMAEAVSELYPKTKIAIGPDIEHGFYYDFDFTTANSAPTLEDLPKIEEKMRELIAKGSKFSRKVVSKKEALEIFKDEPYKTELINELPEGEEISIYTSGNFTDLCRGPHIENTKEIDPESFKLAKIAGAYWRGSEENQMLTRIYAYAFEDKAGLEDFLKKLEEAEKRDHRTLGQKLDLFHFDEEIGPGLILWHPNGAMLKRTIENYAIDQYLANGYQLLSTPHIAKLDLWKTSGHAGFYNASMFPSFNLSSKDEGEKVDYQLKPMNCPFHIAVYKHALHSYKELPIRYTELGTVYRYEKSGTLHGLTRVRGFTQDDAHIFCTKEQIDSEVAKLMDLTFNILKDFGFKDFTIFLSTKPDDSIGEPEVWDLAQNSLKGAMEKLGLKYEVDEGGGAFYGPKIDIKIKDALDRQWQCTTIQVDFQLPERFDLHYINDKGEKVRPIMIHRALLGSIERFIGVLLEYHAGNLPLWLAPEQVRILPINDKVLDYANEVATTLRQNGFKVAIDASVESIGKKIRNGETQRIPYLLVVGGKEAEAKTVAVRKRIEGDKGALPIQNFLEMAKKDIAEKL